MYTFDPFKKQIALAEDWLKKEFQQIRTGQASPAILDAIKVEVYGQQMSLKEVASIAIESGRIIRIEPWDKGNLKDMEKGVNTANLGVSVVVDDKGLRVTFPELTAERRVEIVKAAKDKLEEARKQIRRERDTIVKDIQAKEKEDGMGKDEIFRLKNEVQKLVDESNKRLEGMYEKKRKEIIS